MSNPAQGIAKDMTSWPNSIDWREATTTLQELFDGVRRTEAFWVTALPRHYPLPLASSEGRPLIGSKSNFHPDQVHDIQRVALKAPSALDE